MAAHSLVVTKSDIPAVIEGDDLVLKRNDVQNEQVLNATIRSASSENYHLILPLNKPSLDQELGLRVPPNLDSMVRILSDVLGTARAAKANPSSTPPVQQPPALDLPLDGVAIESGSTKDDAAEVVLTRMEIPVAYEDRPECKQWVTSARAWVEKCIRRVDAGSSPRDWLIVSLLCFAGCSVLRTLPRRGS